MNTKFLDPVGKLRKKLYNIKTSYSLIIIVTKKIPVQKKRL